MCVFCCGGGGCSGTAGPVSTVARLHLNRFSSVTVLDGQLANVQRRIEGYQRDNDTIRRRVESLGDRSMLERLEGKVGAVETRMTRRWGLRSAPSDANIVLPQVRWKEARLLQLGEERKALLLLRRNYEKQLVRAASIAKYFPPHKTKREKIRRRTAL